MHPLVIVSDVHLGHRRCDDVASDLARLVTKHPQHEIVLNGDTFNLSCDPWTQDPAASSAAMLADHPQLAGRTDEARARAREAGVVRGPSEYEGQARRKGVIRPARFRLD
jgi:hypothetical protein